MPDSPGPEWALAGVVVGAVIGGFAQIFASWLQWRRDEKRARRSRRADNLYLIQEHITEAFALTRAIATKLNSLDESNVASWISEDNQLKTEFTTINSLSVRVGDGALAHQLGPMLMKLSAASKTGADAEALISEATWLNSGVNLRIGLLLHTDTETDYGSGKFPRWYELRSKRDYRKSFQEAETRSRVSTHKPTASSGDAPVP